MPTKNTENFKKLLMHIKAIKGNADFEDCQITSLGKLQSIGRDADFSYSQLTSLGELKEIGGDAWFENYKLETNTKLLKAATTDKKFNGMRIYNLKAIELKNGNIININQELNKAA